MTPASADYAAIVLAAGRSTRMGQDKAGLPWLDGQPLLEWTVAKLRDAGWRPIVVLGPHNFAAWRDRLPPAVPVLNPHAALGKSTSLAAGAAAIPADPARLLVASVDQPRTAELYRAMRVAAEARAETILTPDWNGRRGHPVVLAGELRPRLRSLGERGLRGLLDEFPLSTHRVPGDPEGQRWDCNTPEAYREALAWFQAKAG